MQVSLRKLSHLGSLGSSLFLQNRRLVVPVVLLALLLSSVTRELVVGTLADAFWQVASYVAATLALFHFLTEHFDRKSQFTKTLAQNHILQISFSSFMGALPGCGGAIVVVTQYVRGNLSFGSVVAVLTATMGDAAFLLLATRPSEGLMIVALGASVGWISGYLVDRLHGVNFLRPDIKVTASNQPLKDSNANSKRGALQSLFWKVLLLPSLIIALIGSFQVDANALFHVPQGAFEFAGAVLAWFAVLLWAMNGEITDYQSAVCEDKKGKNTDIFQRVAQDTNFILVWVIGAFLLFELTVFWLGIDLSTVFTGWALLLPAMGVIVGLLPGCGPQILVTSLYISGVVPISAQIGNAISNDGDALFPAIALAPKAAIVATIYSAIPAFVAAYTYFFLFEVA
ncbi:hypothetical protein CS022_08760 [Veronia nyctiphanis]|uniref:Manganese transporter n=1 Tax=Veronia nyctiphanis TaxID=1278244 RepID=A0A4Q0YSE1_9GAMM|nr:putative manganese transporter [Veronia nyctiphanis]RXJ73583.1 hypothetical protein CS022_08760 [Veronia nyctiphanis]